ncbi:hypothetical protein HY312_04920 [Candidatus Saccharibacteria bacterium]|nr:hypothetical protein [Candidatus Saccharibacteria bacterium]
MLINGFDLLNAPVMSLQTGGELARTTKAIINPHNLTIIAYELAGPQLDHHPSFLRINDIREVSPVGIIVDSSEEFVLLDDIINQKDIYELHFTLEHKVVLDENRKKVGKVTSYNFEAGAFVIQQLTIQRPLLKSFNDSELIIHRSQILEVTDHAIVIKAKNVAKIVPDTAKSYVNPFRQSPQAEAMRIDQE